MILFGFVIFCLVCENFVDSAVKVIIKGGYTAKLCVPNNGRKYKDVIIGEDIIKDGDSRSFNCTLTNIRCDRGVRYLCALPCNFRNERVEVDNRILNIINEKDIHFRAIIDRKDKVFYNDGHLIINSTAALSLLPQSEVSVSIHNHSDIACSNLTLSLKSIDCRLDLSKMKVHTKVSRDVFVRYGYEHCSNTFKAGTISVIWPSLLKRLWLNYFWKLFVVILLMCGLIFIIIIRKKSRRVMINNILHRKQLEDQEIKYVRTQKKAFLEIQTAVEFFSDLGSLTPRHILNFYNFTSRVFNIELSLVSSNNASYKNEAFQEFILNENKLISWIEKIENDCKLQQRSLVSSLLTIVLFQHPKYFLVIIKRLLVNYIRKVKECGEERIVFRKSEAIVEKLVGNWITLCMYKNLKSGDVGKRFYDLYRALKCKMNQGLVDCLTNKAKYALTFDHIMLGDIDYEVLNIKADVDLNLKTMDSSDDLLIQLMDVDVQVLSLDSITQVKGKIFDKAVMVYSQKENLNNDQEDRDFCVELVDLNELRLQLINSTVKIILNDFDRTNLTSAMDKDRILVNTMKHYNMKTGTRFLLSLHSKDDIECYLESCLTQYKKVAKVHLQLTQDQSIQNPEIRKQTSNESQTKMFFNPVVEDMNKEAYLMRLLASKQSVIFFIDDFFRSIFNSNPNSINKRNSSTLFERQKQPLFMSSSKKNSQDLKSSSMYVTPVYYLFTMLDDIATLLGITDNNTISLWKSNSFILRFWVNLIKNPNFIFSVDKIGPIDGSLTTIASVLMESCSLLPKKTIVNENLPIVKQLFLKELKVYSSWWKLFTESATTINDEVMILYMEEIVETYSMNKHYNSCLTSLQAISNTFSYKVLSSEEVSKDKE